MIGEEGAEALSRDKFFLRVGGGGGMGILGRMGGMGKEGINRYEGGVEIGFNFAAAAEARKRKREDFEA